MHPCDTEEPHKNERHIKKSLLHLERDNCLAQKGAQKQINQPIADLSKNTDK